ncbi:nucleotide sugar dehydrogenase [Paenibacillus hemerocallicola]|uniref:Nucleotide sugar dehydrogenase n=1 Tax=Paenibacillus hemerocallicola TaxID=1172614 RepID=A0A5C4TDV8_9BACL|nr:nucleotide sugar dehydrogenase [Paenibacillus hemerocallicola]TNJ66707.1 nucleotide sugar dehydrogenase [Paenibacillus hemerocallicola]
MNRTIGVVGLGYVGLPVAVAFGELQPVVGFDINPHRISTLQRHMDSTGEVSREDLSKASIDFTTDETRLQECDFIIVAVPTPIDHAKKPDLGPLISASQTVGRNLRKGSILVYESTVYPGTTEEICIPVLEKHSGLVAGTDFFVGYSPERINPGDKNHTFKKIVKVVSGQNEQTLNVIADMYGMVVDAGVYRAPSIKVAEAAKVIENTQRDLNIALMNELAIIFDRLDIDTSEVLRAAGTKWNFLSFTPGLVGGHCIGVDPYYLTYKAESVGYHPQVILAGRRINDGMGQFIVTSLVKQMILSGIPVQEALVTVMGVTFKENVPDIRNSKIVDIVRELQDFGIRVQLCDPLADPEEVQHEYGLSVVPAERLEESDVILLAVPHQDFAVSGWNRITSMLRDGRGIVFDVKSVLEVAACPENVTYCRL